MFKTNYYFLLIALFCLSCQQHEEVLEKSITVEEVKAYFQGLPTVASGRSDALEIIWEEGTYKDVTTGDALVFPISGNRQHYAKTEDGEVLIPVGQVSHALAYLDSEAQIHLDFVQQLPTAQTTEFTGHIIAGTWGEEPQWVFSFENGQLLNGDHSGRLELECTTVNYYECTAVSVNGVVYGNHCDLVRQSTTCTSSTAPGELAPEDFGNLGAGSGDGETPALCPHPDLAGQFVPCDEIVDCGEGFTMDAYGDCVEEIILTLDLDQNPYSDANECERAFFHRNKTAAISMYGNKSVASNKTKELFPKIHKNAHVNDCADAFRHAYFSALNTKTAGEQMAREVGEAHECNVPQHLELSSRMDLLNNEVGIQIGLSLGENATNGELALAVWAALENGSLKYLSHINYDDPCFKINSDCQFVTSGITFNTNLICSDRDCI